MVTKLDIPLEDIVKSAKTKLATVVLFTLMTLLPNFALGNLQTSKKQFLSEKSETEIYIENGNKYLEKIELSKSDREYVEFLNKARFEFIKALNISTNCDALVGLGKVELKSQNIYEAKKFLEHAVSCYKKEKNKNKLEEAYLSMADVYSRLGNYKKIEECAKNALNFNQLSYKAYNKLGLMYFSQKKYSEAIKNFEKAVSINPNYAFAIANIAHSYLEQGKIKEAEENIEKALKISSYPQIIWIKALIHKKKGEHEKAIFYMEEAFKMVPYADNYAEEIKKYKKEIVIEK